MRVRERYRAQRLRRPGPSPQRHRRSAAVRADRIVRGSWIWTIQSGVFPENTASLRLHAQAGFRVVGTRERIGLHHGRWRDVVFIERRSSAVGARLA
jgi:hypothetical protein